MEATTPQYSPSAESANYASMDNSIPDAFVALLNETASINSDSPGSQGDWTSIVTPGNDGKLIWGWSKTCEPSTKMCVKLQFILSDVSMDTLFECIQPEVRFNHWDKAEGFQVLEKDESQNSQIIYHKLKKPPMPLVWQRDVVFQVFSRANYVSTAAGNCHVNALVSVEHANAPVNDNLVRAIRDVSGILVEPCSEGSKVTIIQQMDLGGSMASMAVSKAAGKIPTAIYNTLYPYALA